MTAKDEPDAFVYGTVGLIAAVALAYELLLLRVFSYSQWHHFASLAVALALLGFGASGTALTLLGKRAVRWGDHLFLGGLIIGSTGIVVAFWISQWITVRPLFAVWDLRELGKLLLVDFASFIPFFGFGLALGQVFARWPESIPRLYAANLLGAGAGSLLALGMLSALYLEYALIGLPLATFAAGCAYAWHRHCGKLVTRGCALAAALLGLWIYVGVPQLPLSDFKQLAYLLEAPNAKVLERRPGFRSEVRVVQSDYARIAPGLSMQWMETVPLQDLLVLGSDQVYPLPQASASSDYRQATLANLPFILRDTGEVAWLGTSEWLPPRQVRPISWIIENPQVMEIMRTRAVNTDWKYKSSESRLFLDTNSDLHSIIFFSRAASEGDAASEDFLLTVEGLQAGLSRLEQGGVLAIPLTLSYPPRFAPKLLATAVLALREISPGMPVEQVALLRSLHAGLLLLTNQPFSPKDVGAIRSFAEQWGFDLVALPGLVESETNRYHQWPSPLLYQSAQAILTGEGSVPAEASWFSLKPPRDWRPYFWQSMKWTQLPELWNSLGRNGLIWLDWTLLATALKLGVAAALATVLILLPLKRLQTKADAPLRFRVWLYFSALGLGYLLVEMAAFQRSIRFAADPMIAASLVFATFLIGSGLGSLSTPDTAARSGAARIFAPIVAWSVFAFLILGYGQEALLALPNHWRLASIGLALFPLAWAMGRAFPWGLRRLDGARDLIPWAWGINGFASVLAAPLAVLIAVQWSQFATWLAGGMCYLAAGWVAIQWTNTTCKNKDPRGKPRGI